MGTSRNSHRLLRYGVAQSLTIADTGPAKSLTIRTQFRRIVIDYMPTLLKHIEGFSQILKEQSGKEKYSGVLTFPIAII